MEYLLYQALNSLICISSAKQISAQAVTQLGNLWIVVFHCNQEIEAQRIKRFTESLKVVNARGRNWRRSLGGCDHWLTQAGPEQSGPNLSLSLECGLHYPHWKLNQRHSPEVVMCFRPRVCAITLRFWWVLNRRTSITKERKWVGEGDKLGIWD